VNVDAHTLQIARTAHPKLGIAPGNMLNDLAEQAVSDTGLDLDGYDGQFMLTEWEQVRSRPRTDGPHSFPDPVRIPSAFQPSTTAVRVAPSRNRRAASLNRCASSSFTLPSRW